MKIPLKELQQIIDKELPAPGSINYDNVVDEVKIPLYKTFGLLSMGNENDICGMEPGHAEFIRDHVGTLVFKKNKAKQDWDIVILNEETKKEIRLAQARIDLLEGVLRQVQQQLKTVIATAIKEGKTVADIQYQLTGIKPKKKRKPKDGKPTG